jgi:hypothetical protein
MWYVREKCAFKVLVGNVKERDHQKDLSLWKDKIKTDLK